MNSEIRIQKKKLFEEKLEIFKTIKLSQVYFPSKKKKKEA